MLKCVSEKSKTGLTTVIYSQVGVFVVPNGNVRGAVMQFNALAKENPLAGNTIVTVLHADSSAAGSLRDKNSMLDVFEWTRKDHLSNYERTYI